MPDSNVRRLEFQRTPLPNLNLAKTRVQLTQELFEILPNRTHFSAVSVVNCNIVS